VELIPNEENKLFDGNTACRYKKSAC